MVRPDATVQKSLSATPCGGSDWTESSTLLAQALEHRTVLRCKRSPGTKTCAPLRMPSAALRLTATSRPAGQKDKAAGEGQAAAGMPSLATVSRLLPAGIGRAGERFWILEGLLNKAAGCS